MLPPRRGEQFTGVIDCRVDHRGEPRSSGCDGELRRQVGINLLDIQGTGTSVVNGDLEVKRGNLLKESRERWDHGLE